METQYFAAVLFTQYVFCGVNVYPEKKCTEFPEIQIYSSFLHEQNMLH